MTPLQIMLSVNLVRPKAFDQYLFDALNQFQMNIMKMSGKEEI